MSHRTYGIVYETSSGYITLEKTGKSMAYVVWVHGATAATRRHTFGLGISNALERAKAALDAAKTGAV